MAENKGIIERALPAITALSLIVTPLAVAYIGYQSQGSAVSKDYVSIAVNILNQKDSSKESREWAIKLLNTLSPVPFTAPLKKGLDQGDNLAGVQPVEVVKVSVPVGVPCLTSDILKRLVALKPNKPDLSDKNMSGEQRLTELFFYVERLENYSDASTEMLKTCSDEGPLGKALGKDRLAEAKRLGQNATNP